MDWCRSTQEEIIHWLKRFILKQLSAGGCYIRSCLWTDLASSAASGCLECVSFVVADGGSSVEAVWKQSHRRSDSALAE